ncbi:MAG: HAD family hydrolase [Candidatus Scalindua sp. AMX11]|nr:MAG: HAD family hydrolase [Candidatus Scalindua sp.]NOG83609.1 HAD-IA family hydrolase [Planctomycetota bacterium]RZV69639.1 MAG: HAD family hydrolase [Candidatus Scalindua sp. SCAELEC01]TDE64096.1 MAG: HAD family hydrolase [Candidatus Scalindua sp. AMX11]GJQ60158.1 MAG: haloacid dehalogenase [Candidatus Scalindua sp.]
MRKFKHLDVKLVIFDCDGVMFNTEKANTAYYNQILRHFNRPDMTPEQFSFVQMHTAHDSLSHLFGERLQDLEQVIGYSKQLSYLPFFKYMEIEPYLKPLLNKLRPVYKTAIATNRTDTMNSVLMEHGLENCFDIVVSALDVDRPKPHPDPLLKVLDHFLFKPYEAIYIGDSKLDEQAAEKAEIPLIAYDNVSLSSDFHINSLQEIEKILTI